MVKQYTLMTISYISRGERRTLKGTCLSFTEMMKQTNIENIA